MRRIDTVVIHCSDSLFGDASLIDLWHRERGWKGIGYHYLILNGYPTEASFRLGRPQFHRDGEVETGRSIEKAGAHVRGQNSGSVGVCLIGKAQFTAGQFASLARLIAELKAGLGELKVLGHYEALRPGDSPKSCPNLDMEWIRGLLGGIY